MNTSDMFASLEDIASKANHRDQSIYDKIKKIDWSRWLSGQKEWLIDRTNSSVTPMGWVRSIGRIARLNYANGVVFRDEIRGLGFTPEEVDHIARMASEWGRDILRDSEMYIIPDEFLAMRRDDLQSYYRVLALYGQKERINSVIDAVDHVCKRDLRGIDFEFTIDLSGMEPDKWWSGR